MLVWTGIICFLLFIFRIPLEQAFNSSNNWGGCFSFSLNFYRHFGYVVGYQTEYAEEPNGCGILQILFMVFSMVLSIAIHILLIVGFLVAVNELHNWAKK